MVHPQLTLWFVELNSEMTNIKPYFFVCVSSVKAHLQETNPDRVDKFVADAGPAVKKVLANLKDYQVTKLNLISMISKHLHN